jgi:hypothetical protein
MTCTSTRLAPSKPADTSASKQTRYVATCVRTDPPCAVPTSWPNVDASRTAAPPTVASEGDVEADGLEHVEALRWWRRLELPEGETLVVVDGPRMRGHAARYGAHDGDVAEVAVADAGVDNEERGRRPVRGERDGAAGVGVGGGEEEPPVIDGVDFWSGNGGWWKLISGGVVSHHGLPRSQRVEQRSTVLGVTDDGGAARGGEVADARNRCPA